MHTSIYIRKYMYAYLHTVLYNCKCGQGVRLHQYVCKYARISVELSVYSTYVPYVHMCMNAHRTTDPRLAVYCICTQLSAYTPMFSYVRARPGLFSALGCPCI